MDNPRMETLRSRAFASQAQPGVAGDGLAALVRPRELLDAAVALSYDLSAMPTVEGGTVDQCTLALRREYITRLLPSWYIYS